MVNMRIQRPNMRDCDPAQTCITAIVRPWGTHALHHQRQMADLRLHDAGDLPMAFGAAPDPTFGPQRQFPQFCNCRMVIARHLVGNGQIVGIEDPRLAAKQRRKRAASSTTSRE